jgi:hypothetical protein
MVHSLQKTKKYALFRVERCPQHELRHSEEFLVTQFIRVNLRISDAMHNMLFASLSLFFLSVHGTPLNVMYVRTWERSGFHNQGPHTTHGFDAEGTRTRCPPDFRF